MVKKEEFSILSSDAVSQLHCVCWIPQGEVKAVLQISHGMIEHILRYQEFASVLAEHGIVVVGHDHLGHGTTVSEDKLGYFADQNGAVCVIKDLHRVTAATKKHYTGVPYFVLGHSMGSFFVRRYLTIYGDDIDGAIIMGTGNQPLPMLVAGKLAASVIGALKGKSYRSNLMHNLVLGGYNKSFLPAETSHDWLSRDREQVRKYNEDPYCNFQFTCSAYKDFFCILLDLKRRKQFENIPKYLPLYIVSGAKDPVGNFGKGVCQVYEEFEKLGMQEVCLKLYDDCRHEILNETNKDDVYEDILRWLCAHID